MVYISVEAIHKSTFIAKQIYGERMIVDVWPTSGPAWGFTEEHVQARTRRYGQKEYHAAVIIEVWSCSPYSAVLNISNCIHNYSKVKLEVISLYEVISCSFRLFRRVWDTNYYLLRQGPLVIIFMIRNYICESQLRTDVRDADCGIDALRV